MSDKIKVFLCYAKEDIEKVEELYKRLKEEGFDPWLDTENLLPGDEWVSAIKQAIRGSDFFLACFSFNSIKDGFLNVEITEALKIWEERSEGKRYLIPVRLEECDVPKRLRRFHWVDAYTSRGLKRLLSALKTKQRNDKTQLYLISRQWLNVSDPIAFTEMPIEFIQNTPFSSKRIGRLYKPLERIRQQAAVYKQSLNPVYQKEAAKQMLIAVNEMKGIVGGLPNPIPNYFGPVIRSWEGMLEHKIEGFSLSVADNGLVKNIYIPGDSLSLEKLHGTNLFLGRFDMIRELERQIREMSHKQSFLLEGQRRVGKTSILLSLPALLPKEEICSIFFDLQDAKISNDIETFYRSIMDKTEKELKINFAKQKDSLIPVIFSEWLDKIENYLGKKKKYLLWCFDEYEKIDQRITEKATGFNIQVLEIFRHIIQHHPQIFIILSGAANIEDLTNNWYSYLISVITIPVKYLKKEDAQLLITKPFNDFPIKYTPKAIEEIIYITACQPMLLQAMCYNLVEIFNEINSKRNRIEIMDESHITMAARKTLENTARNYFGNFYYETCRTENERRIIKSLALGQSIEEEPIIHLVQMGYLVKKRNGLDFRIPLMKTFIKEHASIF